MENKNILKSVWHAGKALAVFAMVSSALVAITFALTENRIIENERQALLHNLHQLVSQENHDNDLYSDNLLIDASALNYRGKPITVYRARKNGKPVSAIFSVVAPDGYNGAINLLIAINDNESIAGVRVVSHKETPGLGDAIDIQKSNWVRIFDNKSFTNPAKKDWRVKKDGGYFDQLTGATITPRAVVKMSKNTLEYFSTNKIAVFETRPNHGNTKP